MINSQIAVLKESGTVYYIHGHLPVFQHAEKEPKARSHPHQDDLGSCSGR